jgi:hypothetical protein
VNEVEVGVIEKLQTVIEKHKGKCALYVEVNGLSESKADMFQVDNKFRVAPTAEFINSVSKLNKNINIKISN